MDSKAVYTCPMHPEIVRDAPGSCPKCGMTLVLVAGTDVAMERAVIVRFVFTDRSLSAVWLDLLQKPHWCCRLP